MTFEMTNGEFTDTLSITVARQDFERHTNRYILRDLTDDEFETLATQLFINLIGGDVEEQVRKVAEDFGDKAFNAA
jgi:hypothetical protein